MYLRHSISLLITSITMLTRAFTVSNTVRNVMIRQRTSTSSPVSSSFAFPFPTHRFMTTGSDGETTIVQKCTTKIMEALQTDDVKVTGAYDDPNGSHISIEVVSSLFEGKRAVQRQQLVYKALWDELQGPVHAVDSMICKTPEEK